MRPRSVMERRLFARLLVGASQLGAPVRAPADPIDALGGERRHNQPFLMSRTVFHPEGDPAGFAEKVAGGDSLLAGNFPARRHVGGTGPGAEQGHGTLALAAQQIQRGICTHVSITRRGHSSSQEAVPGADSRPEMRRGWLLAESASPGSQARPALPGERAIPAIPGSRPPGG